MNRSVNELTMNPPDKHVYEAELVAASDLRSFFESSMLVTQTEFFRQPNLYQWLTNTILPQLLDQPRRRPTLRIWSAGCSDGHEPFSIAMCVAKWFKIRYPHESPAFSIYASDINREYIENARRAEYRLRKNEIDRLSPYAEYYDTLAAGIICISPRIRQLVEFALEDITRPRQRDRFDIIVCTNVLLYYEKEYRKVIADRLIEALNEGGYLYTEAIGSRFLKSLGLQRVSPASQFFRKTMSKL